MWLRVTFRPSKAGNWLLYATALSAIWLNSVAHLATRDPHGFASTTVGEWLRIALGAAVLVALLVLALGAHRRCRQAALQS